MRLQDYLIGLIMVALFTIIMLGFAHNMYAGMSVEVDNETSEVFTAFERQANITKSQMISQTDEMRQKSPGGTEVTQGNYDEDFSSSILLSGWRVLSIIPVSYQTFQGLLRVFANNIGIDPIFIYSFMAIIVIVITMILISSILQNRL